ncbi:GalNAc-alpha-(1,4)-GalNAc-alpha-(1,3)-diNAcBac-PP-undecaprenol alpha-1,4-N-acetyl-D-galactosaminyltransferase [Campylobacter subantarcticus LMG 24377]|uniref:GalNAc alpha1-4 transferase n=1 Tax=Campylobacter subantarcticus TaxID=497724 RepID=A0ABW9N6H2_9BACT|nr:GalNAc alpha1-4 transferase [Campylobacter subantarcticus]AJC93030.1 GalNAc-alpha-(1,4)-GalNAc-alpha-(1,3)-diNAcBac-PP-undecaprenol alpha-1,4-N-acetyl-D-galactosaminyltransferase [Campylobacter subantarcticus LMG 24377]EAL3938926.1 GalNAc alpha1-4 transferase [Campylobacter lari]MPB99738.1 GalNAc alpha1-4 transferase [Campylobacter subantarcticus]
MKITFIIATLNSGGAERVLVTLANELCKNHEINIIKFHKEDSFYKLDPKIKLFTLEQFDFSTLYNKIASRIKKFNALKQALKEHKSDVFISFLDTTNIACIWANKGSNTPLIISEHSSHTYLKSKIWKFLRRISFPYANALTVLSNDDKSYYENFVKKVVNMPNPCHFNLTEEKLEKENNVIFVGRLDHNKNASMFLKAIARLDINLQNQYRFFIAGDGELRQELEQEAEKLKIKVHFLGKVENIQELYKKAKILCLCSFIEGLPTVLLESLHYQVARISTKYVSGHKDLIDDKKDGFLVDLNDEKALSEKLALLMQDENLRETLALNAQQRCKDYEVTNIVQKWLDLIKEVRV